MNTPKFKSHESVKKNGDKYICITCNAIMTHRNNVSCHRNMCKGPRLKVVYSCDSCSKQFLYKFKLEEHAKMHSRESYNCYKCSKMCKRKDLFLSISVSMKVSNLL